MSGFADAIDRCIDKGVTERAPIDGTVYAAFVVCPRQPGNVFGFAIAHRDGELHVLDVCWGDVSAEFCCQVIKRYGIAEVVGTVGDESTALAHAVAGVFAELGRRQ